ncbi:MAG: twin-arginine translocase TatA/TatE family subunit [Proteobacteria bacterium]|nr:twin-arginine translocase TatA/TatE family subunit [Pseudomonadota bacterium]
MFGLSFSELTAIAVVALIVLGPRRLPALAKGLGEALRQLRRASADLRGAVDQPLRELREPLEELRGDLQQTVHHFERQVHRVATEEPAPQQAAAAPATEAPALPPPREL